MNSPFWQGAEISGSLLLPAENRDVKELTFSITQTGKTVYNSAHNVNLQKGNNKLCFYINSSRRYKKTPIWDIQYLDNDSAFCLEEGDYLLEIRWDGNVLKSPFTVLGKNGVEESEDS